jgi:hypothetical protein
MRNNEQVGRIALGCLLMLLAVYGPAAVQDSALAGGHPAEKLPPHIRQITWFGERPVWSPDGRALAFLSKSYGDVMEYELATGRIRCLTCYFRHEGFLRVHYLLNGDYLLIGPASFKDADISRNEEAELWVLGSELSEPAVRLGQRLWEGVAVSRRELRIAWANNARQYPERIRPGLSELYVAALVYNEDERPRLAAARKVLDSQGTPCWLEPQDFRRDDGELIYTCYRSLKQASVMGVDLESGVVTDYSQSPDEFQEPEGLFPDEAHIAVESDRHNDLGVAGIDIWKLCLDGTGSDMERLTFFSESPGWRADNPTISPDGHWMAFQPSRSDDAPGVGHGIFLYQLSP